jgi:hypothetical protein
MCHVFLKIIFFRSCTIEVTSKYDQLVTYILMKSSHIRMCHRFLKIIFFDHMGR